MPAKLKQIYLTIYIYLFHILLLICSNLLKSIRDVAKCCKCPNCENAFYCMKGLEVLYEVLSYFNIWHRKCCYKRKKCLVQLKTNSKYCKSIMKLTFLLRFITF